KRPKPSRPNHGQHTNSTRIRAEKSNLLMLQVFFRGAGRNQIPLEGEGMNEFQQGKLGEGVSSRESSCEEAPSPIIACGNPTAYMHSPARGFVYIDRSSQKA